MNAVPDTLRTTKLHALHRALGAKLVGFAGYEMPLQYPGGLLAEHHQTRRLAGLFDVSHMGQFRLSGLNAAEALERLVPGDIASLAPGGMRYTMLLNEAGCIVDDLMVTRRGDHLLLVVNAATKAGDLALLQAGLGAGTTIEECEDRALLALQGPEAAAVVARLAPDLAALPFMAAADSTIAGIPVLALRSGYTGEDGFELSVAASHAEALASRLLAEPEVAPIGLGARDSLRLEAGLCLYGHDIDETTTPIEAALSWTIGKRRRREGGFPGAAIIQRQLAEGPPRRRVGIRPEGRAPAREHTEIIADGITIGTVTSGGFGPTVDGPIAMGYVDPAHAAPGSPVDLLVRGVARPARIVALPFVPHRYHRG